MKCPFCRQSIFETHTKMLIECHDCMASFHFNTKGSIIYYELKSGLYRINLDIKNNTSWIEHWEKYDKTAKKSYDTYVTILKLDFCPKHINPINVMSKINLLILFS